MTIRVGISGAGRISRFHAAGFIAAGCEIVGVADPRREAADLLTAEYGGTSFESLDQMLDEREIDIVSIATPHDIHQTQAELALRRGVDVFMDKPMALTTAGGAQLAATARETSRTLGICHNLLFHPAISEAHAVIESGGIGDVVSCEAWSMGWLDLAPGDFRLDRAKTGGGAWFDAGAHLLYTLEHLVGELSVVVGLPATGRSRLGGEDAAVAVAAFSAGAVASMRISYAHRAPESAEPWPAGWRQGFEVNGTLGAVRVAVSPEGVLERYSEGDPGWTRTRYGVDFAETFSGAIADFLTMRAGGPSVTTPAKSLRILELLAGAIHADH